MQILLDSAGCSSLDDLLSLGHVSSLEELYSLVNVSDMDSLLSYMHLIQGYDPYANEAFVIVSNNFGLEKYIDLSNSSSVHDLLAENGTYIYTITNPYNTSNTVKKQITISWLDESVDDENIFIFDESTGYITGIKEEYISRTPIQTYGIEISSPKYLLKGAPILNIPSTIHGKIVKGIGDSAFYEVLNITRVIFPDTIEVIGSNAFLFSSNLKKVEFPSSVTTLKDRCIYANRLKRSLHSKNN